MKTLDRYITRTFLVNFLILLFVFTSLFIVVDMIIQLDEFVDAGRDVARETGRSRLPATLGVIIDFYAPLSLLIYVFLSGLVVVAAAGFTFAMLVRSRELTAMVSSGISMYRVALPVVVVACLLSGVTLLLQELVIPPLATKLARPHRQARHARIPTFAVQFAPDKNGHLISAAQFDADHHVLKGVTILERNQTGEALRRITAAEATWSERGGEGGGWRLVDADVTYRSVSAASEQSPEQEMHFFATDLSPQALLARRAAVYSRLLSLAQLRSLLDNPSVDRAEIYQIMHGRFSGLVMNILVLIMGLPFFLLREPSALLPEAVKAAGVCLGAWATALVLTQAAPGQLNAVAAAWLPVAVFLPVAALLGQLVKT